MSSDTAPGAAERGLQLDKASGVRADSRDVNMFVSRAFDEGVTVAEQRSARNWVGGAWTAEGAEKPSVNPFAGQFCMTGSRILVQRGIADKLKAGLAERLNKVKPGRLGGVAAMEDFPEFKQIAHTFAGGHY